MLRKQPIFVFSAFLLSGFCLAVLLTFILDAPSQTPRQPALPLSDQNIQLKKRGDVSQPDFEAFDLFYRKPQKTDKKIAALKKKTHLPPDTDIAQQQNHPHPPTVVVIIDDMGLDARRSREIINLPGSLTLSFLPYAHNLYDKTRQAKAQGHGLMLHMPMEAVGGQMMDTPGMLHHKLEEAKFLSVLDENLSKMSGYVGINNHMGSGLTQNESKMKLFMAHIKKAGLYFVDSRTIHTSVAEKVAADVGIPILVRDVFLDHQSSLEFARNALLKTERIALEKGVAIAIGHPKDATIQALAEWIPTLKDKRIRMITADELVQQSHPTYRIRPTPASAVWAQREASVLSP